MSNKKYHFTHPEIIAEQKSFTQTLQLNSTTIRKYSNYLGLFLTWLYEEQIASETVRTVDVLAFIDSIRKDTSRDMQKRILNVLRLYFDYKEHPHNPVLGIRLRGGKRKQHYDLLEKKTLDKIYKDYPVMTVNDGRDKVALGLVVYQALSSGDLHQLKVTDIELEKGKIHVPGHKQVNGRTLTLQGFQILELYEYIHTIRPQLLGRVNSAQLLISSRGNEKIKNTLHKVMKTLKARTPGVKNLGQIRRSVITEWLKTKDVRIVQYMAGHKRVSSTESYQIVNVEDLKKQLNQFHPLV